MTRLSKFGEIEDNPACPKCGHVIEPEWVACPCCGNRLGPHRCSSCGKPVQSDWCVCPACGISLASEPASSGKKSTKEAQRLSWIEQKVIEIVAEQMDVDKRGITRKTSFVNDLNADSLDTVELVMEFEDEFELSIPDDVAEKARTVGQVIDYIREHADRT